MKATRLHFLLALLVLAALGQAAPVYTDAEAAAHVGEEATVTGRVAAVTVSGKGTTFINLGGRFPNHSFGAVIFAGNQAAVGDVKAYEGREVSITGRIEVAPDKKPQIVVSRPEQIRLAGAAPGTPATAMPAPGTPAAPGSVPTSTPAPAPAPTSKAPETPTTSVPASGTIELAKGWNSSRRGGELVRKDLARLFGDVASAAETTRVDSQVEIYPGVTFLMPLAGARRALGLENGTPKKTKVVTPGFPQDSFNAQSFEGVFPGGFTRLVLVTDAADQVVSVLLVDSSSRARVNNETDSDGYHTYNFVTGDWKAANYLFVKHSIASPGKTDGVVVVDTMLVDPTDPEPAAPGRTFKPSSRSSSSAKPRTGKVLERSRWFIPAPVVSLILRCVGG